MFQHCSGCCINANSHHKRRERIASEQMAGVLANNSTAFDYRNAEHRRRIADMAVMMADALIAALDGEAGDGE